MSALPLRAATGRTGRTRRAVAVLGIVLPALVAAATSMLYLRERRRLAEFDPVRDVWAHQALARDYFRFFELPPAAREVSARARALKSRGDRLVARLPRHR